LTTFRSQPSLADHPTGELRYRWVVAGTAFFAVLCAIGLGRFAYSAVLPAMQQALGLTSAEAGSLASWNQVGYTVMALVGGVLASRFGPRVVVSTGLALTAVGMYLTGISDGLAEASAARLLTGMGNGMVLAPSITLMAAWFRAQRHGFATGMVPAGSSFALVAVGPLVPGLIAAGGAEGWRLAWYVFAGVTAAMTVFNAAMSRNRPQETDTWWRRLRSGELPRRDRQGEAGEGQSSLAALPEQAGCAQAEQTGRAGAEQTDRPSAENSLRQDFRRISRSSRAWHLGSLYLLYGFAFLMFFTFFQKRLIHDLGYSSHTAGILFLVLGVSGTLAGIFWGGISDRVGRGPTLAVVFALEGACGVIFALWDSLPALAAASWIFGFCGLSVPSLMGAACADCFGVRLAPASLGFITFFLGVGQTIGPYIGGALEDFSSSLTSTYLLSAGIFAVGTVVAVFLRRPRFQGTQTRPGESA